MLHDVLSKWIGKKIGVYFDVYNFATSAFISGFINTKRNYSCAKEIELGTGFNFNEINRSQY